MDQQRDDLTPRKNKGQWRGGQQLSKAFLKSTNTSTRCMLYSDVFFLSDGLMYVGVL